MPTKKKITKGSIVSKNKLSFEELMKKALNTPLPKNYKENKPKKKK